LARARVAAGRVASPASSNINSYCNIDWVAKHGPASAILCDFRNAGGSCARTGAADQPRFRGRFFDAAVRMRLSDLTNGFVFDIRLLSIIRCASRAVALIHA
jgi:hypothetical protein